METRGLGKTREHITENVVGRDISKSAELQISSLEDNCANWFLFTMWFTPSTMHQKNGGGVSLYDLTIWKSNLIVTTEKEEKLVYQYYPVDRSTE